MERWMLFLLAAVLLQLLAPSCSGACPNSCDCHDTQVKCTSYIPEITWLNDSDWYRELWLDKIELPILGNHLNGYNYSDSKLYCRQIDTIALTRYIWKTNETAAFDLAIKFFSSLPMLKHLNISQNDFESIEWCKNINGRNITSFNASHNKIYNMDYDTFQGMSQLTELVLANNEFHDLKAAFERLVKLQLLDMSNNRILKLNDVLKSMPDLRRLNLAGNKISFVQSDYFQDLRSLVELDISRNAFVFIRAESLQSLTSLSVLNLSENRLIERDLSLLLDSVRRLEVVDASRIGLWRVPATLTRSVKIMRLVGNQLTAINSGDFDSYPLLKFLDLSGNKLIMIEDDALGRLDDLEELNLYGNILSSVPKSLPSNLKILDLRQNTITTVSSNDLRGLSNLERLDLSGNVVSIIENGAFRHLTALRELDISDNPIKRLTSDALSGPALWRLRMAGMTEFKLDENQNQDTAFPYSTPEYMLKLDLSRSSSLAALFLADNATLSACKRLDTLDLSNANISSIRSDIYYVLPQLDVIRLVGNELNCSKWQDKFVTCHEHEFINFHFKRMRELSNSQAAATATLPLKQQAATITASTTIANIKSSSKRQMKKEFDMLVKPTATPPTTIVKHTTTITDLSTVKVENKIGTTQSAKTFATMQTRTNIREKNTTPPKVPVTDSSSTYFGEERPDLFTLREAKTNRLNVVNKITTAVEDNQNSQTTTRLPSTARLVPTDQKKVTKTTTTMTTTTVEDVTTEAPPAIINLENLDMTTTVYEENLKSPNHMFSEFSRSKVLLANDEEQVSAEELINDRSHRNSEFFSSGAHPGMLILVGAVIGAAAALTVVLSRRATAKGREQYHRQENIALTPTTEQRW